MVEATILAMVEPQAILPTVRASRFWSLEDFRICLPSSTRAELRLLIPTLGALSSYHYFFATISKSHHGGIRVNVSFLVR